MGREQPAKKEVVPPLPPVEPAQPAVVPAKKTKQHGTSGLHGQCAMLSAVGRHVLDLDWLGAIEANIIKNFERLPRAKRARELERAKALLPVLQTIIERLGDRVNQKTAA